MILLAVVLTGGSFELYRALEGLLTSDREALARWLFDGRVALGAAMTAALVGAYHGWVLRREARPIAAEHAHDVAPPAAYVVVLAPRGDAAVVEAWLRARGSGEGWWHDGASVGVVAEQLTEADAGLPTGASHALLRVEPAGVTAQVFRPS